MGIVNTDPKNVQGVNSVIVDSDAGDDISAIKEIDAWARENGFLRTREYSLNRVIYKDRTQVLRGFCYRPDDGEKRAAERDAQKNDERLKAMPSTRDTAELLREIRGK